MENRWFVLLLFVVACFGVAAIGSFWTSSSVNTWYAGLRKPSFTPPSWIFAPVWSTLYLLMALSAWLVWRAAGWSGSRVPLLVFLAQLALNLAWSGLFFGLRLIGGMSRFRDESRRGQLKTWSVIFILVCLQMTTTLRPILGHSDHFLAKEKKFFLTHWADSLGAKRD